MTHVATSVESDVARASHGWPLVVIGSVSLRALATALAVALGFFAVSDDDFARVVIAQRFAQAPSLDPSGTSWLPLPFWLNGAAMLALGPHFWVARAVSIASSLGCAASLVLAAYWLGYDRKRASFAAAAGAVLPHAVWLGYATVPEGISASLCVLGAASLGQQRLSVRVLGAACVTLACLCRYEAWAVAAALCGFNLWDGLRLRRELWLAAVACCLGPLAWLLHGAFNHGDALFFVAKVADYRRMLGRAPGSLWESLIGYPKVLLRAEPELMTLSTLLLWPSLWRQLTQALRRALWISALLLAFLIWGDLGDGAPTHHPERPLLVIWLLLCLALAWLLPSAVGRHRRLLAATLLVAIGLCSIRSWFTRRDAFIDRREELAMGATLQQLVPETDHVLIDIGDYGYFAVMAGFEHPERAAGVADGDPRQPARHFATATERIQHHASTQDARWVVLRNDALSEAELSTLGSLTHRSRSLLLLRLPAPEPAPR